MIAVIRLIDASERHQANGFSKTSATAIIYKILKGNISEQESIIVLNEPYFLKRPYLMMIKALYNGNYIAFLKNVSESKYKPLTINSLIAIFGNTCAPIWKQDSANHGLNSVPLKDVLVEIQAIITEDKIVNNRLQGTASTDPLSAPDP